MTGDVPEQPEGHGAQERDEQHGEVPGVRVVLRRGLLPVPGSVVIFRGVAPAVASGGGEVGCWIRHQMQGAEEAVAQEEGPHQKQGQ